MEFSEFDRGVFVVNLLAIIFEPKTRKILIGKRENDPFIKELSWCFPGGRPTQDKELEDELKLEVKRKTDLDVEVKNIVFAKTYPENRNFLSIYYLCKPENTAASSSDSLVELKWINPSEVGKYFTTSLHPKLLDYLRNL